MPSIPYPALREMPVSSVVPDGPCIRSERLDRLLGLIEPDVVCLLGGVLEG
jgi:hypothetical protein